MLYQEPITQREGALNLCMYADSTCCGIPYMEFSCRYHSITDGIVELWAPGCILLLKNMDTEGLVDGANYTETIEGLF